MPEVEFSPQGRSGRVLEKDWYPTRWKPVGIPVGYEPNTNHLAGRPKDFRCRKPRLGGAGHRGPYANTPETLTIIQASHRCDTESYTSVTPECDTTSTPVWHQFYTTVTLGRTRSCLKIPRLPRTVSRSKPNHSGPIGPDTARLYFVKFAPRPRIVPLWSGPLPEE